MKINQAVILAGGRGTRLSEETSLVPKPMVKIGNLPILIHIMNIYHKYNIRDFVICLGYKGEIIRNYFSNYLINHSDIEIDFSQNEIKVLKKNIPDWRIKLIETGLNSGTAGRIKKISKYLDNENFLFTYGDGLSNININSLIKSHKTSNKILTLTSIENKSRFGLIQKHNNNFRFKEKPNLINYRINGGFGIANVKIFKYIKSYTEMLESTVFEKISKKNQLNVYEHNGFWKAMDTLNDKKILEEIYKKKGSVWIK